MTRPRALRDGGFAQVPNELIGRLAPHLVGLYAYLYSMAFPRGYCRVSEAALAEWARRGERTLRTWLKALEADGVVAVERQAYGPNLIRVPGARAGSPGRQPVADRTGRQPTNPAVAGCRPDPPHPGGSQLPTKTERSGEQTATPPPSTSGEQRRTDGAGDGSCGSNDHGTRPTAAFDADAAEQLRAIGFRGAEAFVRGNDLAADLVEQAIREARDDRTVHSAPAIVRTWLKDPERRDELRARAEEERRIREAAHRRQEEDERHRQALLEKHRREKAAWEAYEAEDPDGAALVRITGDRSLARIGDADVRKWALGHVLSHEHPCDRVAALRQALEDGTAPAAVREWVTGKPAATQAPERLKMQRQPNFGLEPHDVQRMYRTYPHELLMSVFPVIDADPNPAGTAKAWFARDEGCELSEEELVEEVARRAKLNGVPFGRAGGPAG